MNQSQMKTDDFLHNPLPIYTTTTLKRIFLQRKIGQQRNQTGAHHFSLSVTPLIAYDEIIMQLTSYSQHPHSNSFLPPPLHCRYYPTCLFPSCDLSHVGNSGDQNAGRLKHEFTSRQVFGRLHLPCNSCKFHIKKLRRDMIISVSTLHSNTDSLYTRPYSQQVVSSFHIFIYFLNNFFLNKVSTLQCYFIIVICKMN